MKTKTDPISGERILAECIATAPCFGQRAMVGMAIAGVVGAALANRRTTTETPGGHGGRFCIRITESTVTILEAKSGLGRLKPGRLLTVVQRRDLRAVAISRRNFQYSDLVFDLAGGQSYRFELDWYGRRKAAPVVRAALPSAGASE